MKIILKHIGRPVDFRGCNDYAGTVLHGTIETVRHGIASIRYFGGADTGIKYEPAGYVALLDTRRDADRIIEIY